MLREIAAEISHVLGLIFPKKFAKLQRNSCKAISITFIYCKMFESLITVEDIDRL